MDIANQQSTSQEGLDFFLDVFRYTNIWRGYVDVHLLVAAKSQ